jgi:hypothetical protein
MRKPDVTTYHGFNARSVLQGRYPFADFGAYFSFIESCRGKLKRRHKYQDHRSHLHHICPRSRFPKHSEVPANIIKLTIAEHVHAHDLLSMAEPDLYVQPSFIWANMYYASKAARIGGRAAAAVNKARGTSVYSREIQLKGASAGGKVSGRMRVEDGTLARNRTRKHQCKALASAIARDPKHQSRAARIGNHKRYHVRRSITNPHCDLCRKRKAPRREAER